MGLLDSTPCAGNSGLPGLSRRWLVPGIKMCSSASDGGSHIAKPTVSYPRVRRPAWATTAWGARDVAEVGAKDGDVYSTLRASLGKRGALCHGTGSSLLNFSVSERGGHKFLHVGKDTEGILPDVLHERFMGNVKEDILVRRCYEELYDELSADMLRCQVRDTSSVALCGGVITGISGIGKS
jgi:hypothetical protein